MMHTAISQRSNLETLISAPSGRFWKIVILVFLAECSAIVAFYSLKWEWLRALNVQLLLSILQALGCQVQAGVHALTVQGRPFVVDAECTYVDLILCALPFLWRVRRSLAANFAALAGFSALVFVVNLGRVVFAAYATAHGSSWFWSHDMVDYILWYPSLGVIALLWARSLKSLWNEKKTNA